MTAPTPDEAAARPPECTCPGSGPLTVTSELAKDCPRHGVAPAGTGAGHVAVDVLAVVCARCGTSGIPMSAGSCPRCGAVYGWAQIDQQVLGLAVLAEHQRRRNA